MSGRELGGSPLLSDNARGQLSGGDAAGSLTGARTSPVPKLLQVMLFSAIFLQRFAAPIGPDGISVNTLINLVAILTLFVGGKLVIDPLRSALILVFAGYSLVDVAFNGSMASPTSAALLVVMYIPFAFTLASRDIVLVDLLKVFQRMMVVCSAAGIAQFFLQFLVSATWLYTFEGTLPDSILLHGFATYLPIAYGSPLHRSNGFFMVEPSVFSQFVALAIIIELLFFLSKWRLAVYGAAILFAYSGTGLIALVLVPLILVKQRSFGVIIALTLFAGIAVATSEATHIDVIQERAAEFDKGNSSGHARFIAPAKLLDRFVFSDPRIFVFGAGPGAIRNYQQIMPYETHDPAWAKLLAEYGFIGSVLFWALYVSGIFIGSPSAWMSAALTIGFLSFGGELLDPRLGTLLILFCVLPKIRPTRDVAMSEPLRIEVAPT